MVPPPPAPSPPPPPPPPPVVDIGSACVEDSTGALFAEINNLGADGLRGALKKAEKGPVNEDNPAPVTESARTPRKKVVDLGGTPKCALAGKKWSIEYQNGVQGEKAVTVKTDLKQTVYIFKCHDSLIRICGKVNAIVVDNCSKTGVVFDEALASVEVVNCKDVQLQCTKTMPAISIDGCTAITCYLSESFAGAQIITAKSAAVNIIRPTDDDDIVETPIPEQFCTTWKNGTWVTECVDHSD